MVRYTNGNLALKEEHFHQPTKTKRAQTKHKHNPKQPTIPTGEKLLYLSAIVLCMLVAGAVLYQSAQIYSVNTRIQDVQREIEQIEKENLNLELESERLMEPQRLIEWGKALGFEISNEEDVTPVAPDKHIMTSQETKTAYLD